MEQLCTDIRTYADLHGLTPATVVRYAVGANARTWEKWETGAASCSLDTAERIRSYMRGDAEKYAPAKVAS